MKQLFAPLFAFGLALAGMGVARADIQFTGSTAGSFSPAIAGLSFAGGGISALVPVGGGATLSNLGTFTLAPTCSGQNCTQTISTNFTLSVTFSVPTVSGSQQYTATVNGSAKRSGNSSNFNGTVTVDFDNSAQTLSYTTAGGSGTFQLSVDDPAALSINGGTPATTTVTGAIANVTFTPTSTTAPVPEPATIGLLGGVFGLVAFAVRRRRTV